MKAFVLVIILNASYSFCFAQTTPTAGQERPPTVEELKVADPAPGARVDGLHDRKGLIKALCATDSDFIFKQREDVNGQPDFYASDRYNTSVEIIGREDVMASVQWTFRMVIPNNSAVTQLEINRMGNFVGTMGGQEGYDWISTVYKKFMNRPLSDYTETKELHFNRIAEFKYLPQLRKITIIITAKPQE